jgi:hypothetical protein
MKGNPCVLDVEMALEEQGEVLCIFKTNKNEHKSGYIHQKVNNFHFLIAERNTDVAYVIHFKKIIRIKK